MQFLRFHYVRLRHYLWRSFGLRYSAVKGWTALVHEVSGTPLWQSNGLVGLPLDWTLLRRDETGRVVPVESVCAWSGDRISGSAPAVGDQEFDLSQWGVRCARCGSPIHSKYAGMKLPNDVPSCPPCRTAVKRELQ